jgi:hypothetical protein
MLLSLRDPINPVCVSTQHSRKVSSDNYKSKVLILQKINETSIQPFLVIIGMIEDYIAIERLIAYIHIKISVKMT